MKYSGLLKPRPALNSNVEVEAATFADIHSLVRSILGRELLDSLDEYVDREQELVEALLERVKKQFKMLITVYKLMEKLKNVKNSFSLSNLSKWSPFSMFKGKK